MKLLFWFLLTFLLFSSKSYTQWMQLNFDNSTTIMSVDFSGNNAVLSGVLYDSINNNLYARSWNSIDNGISWSLSQLPDSIRTLGNMQMMSSTLVYGCGSKILSGQSAGAFLQSTNGGQIWTEKGILPDSLKHLRYCCFVSEQTGFAIARKDSSDGIIKTTNGGLTWAWSLLPSAGLNLSELSFYNTTSGFAAGITNQNDGVIIKTTDIGISWTSNILPNAHYLPDFRCIAPEKILYANTSKIFLSQDSGESWNEILSIPLPSYIHGVNGLPGDLIIVYGSWYNITENLPFVYASFDNGQSWTHSILYSLGEFLFADSKIIGGSEWYLAGRFSESGFLLKTSNSGGLPVELISFDASAVNNKVFLSWKTASEKNNLGFALERGINENSFTQIAFINGVGTAGTPSSYSYTDEVDPGNYIYRLKQIDYDGSFSYSKEVLISISSSMNFSLEQNYPNPFNGNSIIKYTVPYLTPVSIKIFNSLGEELENLVNEEKQAGQYELTWNAGNLPSGVYFYRLQAAGFRETRKMILMR